MKKLTLIFLITSILSISSFAEQRVSTEKKVNSQEIAAALNNQNLPVPLDWKVGDEVFYKINSPLGDITDFKYIHAFVAEISTQGIWVIQNFIQKNGQLKYKYELLYDSMTGEVKKFIVDGKEETFSKEEMTITEEKPTTVTVEAGQFESTTFIAKTKGYNHQYWINPSLIPMQREIKINYILFGDKKDSLLTIELTKYNFGK